ncbi:hypothetical protein GN958_ATG06253 [Phytophthora infestans]|uniref:Uncharacterized protein n=1 Tax=Phytophthora infestans TaxID=4787 RepID=A0A8S9V014_PHYIN|nr:hypothetical protein GN958_ATG06253 [Phytophthora infestans]
METLSSTSASGMEVNVTIASKSRIPHWLVVQCEAGSSPSCDAKRVDAVSSRCVHPPDGDELNGDTSFARVRVIKGDAHDQKDIILQLRMMDQLLTLDVAAFRKTVEIVLLQKNTLQRVVHQGSGDVVVENNILSTMGPSLAIATLGSGDLFATSTETVKVDTLTLSSKGSGLLQTTFSELRVSKFLAEYYASGDTTVFVESESDVDSLAVIAEGSGDACFGWMASVSVGWRFNLLMSVNLLEVQQVGSGDVSIGPEGSCQAAKLSTQGSGELDVGGVKCGTVDANLMSSGEVIVLPELPTLWQSKRTFTGATPQSITSTGYSQLYPVRVDDSYLPAHCKRHKLPAIKSKFAAVSSGALASAELDSAENSPSAAVGTGAAGGVWKIVNHDKDNLLPLAGVVVLVALVLRWFNNSRRRAREEQREPLLAAQRRVYI